MNAPADAPTAVPGTAGTRPETAPNLPAQLRLAPGRAVLWRSTRCLQLGLDPHRAVVVDNLPAPLTSLIRALDGLRGTAELLAAAEAAGAAPGDGERLLGDLHRAGLVIEAGGPDAGPPGWQRAALSAEAAAWSVHTTRTPPELLRRRQRSAVRVSGSGRVAVALAAALAASGVGLLGVEAEGTVGPDDIGTGYRPDDLGLPRADAAMRAARAVAPALRQPGRRPPGLVVLTDQVVPDPELVTGLVAARVPHLLCYAHEGRAVVGPLVWPGRSSCLRCADLHRSERDPAWPKLAAQLTGAVVGAGLATTLLAAALGAEQVLVALAGPFAGLPAPPTWGAALEVDAVRGTLRVLPRPAHPECGCGAR